MAKRNRKTRAKNKIETPEEGGLIKVEPDRFTEAPKATVRAQTVAVTRSTLFRAEFEAVIDLIARDRVYRAMLAGMHRRLLMGPPQLSTDWPTIVD